MEAQNARSRRLGSIFRFDESRTWTVKALHQGLASYSNIAIVDGRILCIPEVDQGGRMILASFAPDWPES